MKTGELRFQAERQVPDTIYYVGMEVVEAPSGAWAARYHARTYDGLRVASEHVTGWQVLDATDADAALGESREGLRAFERLYMAACCGVAS